MSKPTAADREISASLNRVKKLDAEKRAATKHLQRRGKTAKADSTHNLDNEGVHDRNDPARQAAARTSVSRDSDLPETWVRPSNLHAPAAKAGMVNRWIRFRAGNDEDKDNLDKAMSQGWRPIPKSSLRNEHELTASLEGKYGQYVVKRGLILMQLPERLWQQRQNFYRDKQQRMTESIDRNLAEANDRRMPFLVPERRTSVTKKAKRGRLGELVAGDEATHN